MAISGVDDFMSLGDTFGGSWRNPAAAAKKIENGLKTIQTAVTKVSSVANNVFSAVTGNDSVLLGKLGNFNSMGVGTMSALAGVAGIGIGSVIVAPASAIIELFDNELPPFTSKVIVYFVTGVTTSSHFATSVIFSSGIVVSSNLTSPLYQPKNLYPSFVGVGKTRRVPSTYVVGASFGNLPPY